MVRSHRKQVKMSQPRQRNEPVLSTYSTKRHKNERQKMIQELKNMKMYEEGMNDKDMSDLLQVIQLSQNMTNFSSHNITESEPLETVPSTPLYSRALITKSPATPEQRDISPDRQSVAHKKSLLQERQVDSPNEPMLSGDINKSLIKETEETQLFNINKACSNISNSLEGMNENKQMNHRQNSQMRQEDKIPKWKINPLDASMNENDERLVAHYHSVDNEGCTEDSGCPSTSNNVDNAVTQLSNHLHFIAEKWYNQRRRSVESKFEWGSAIKVNETSGSWNRKIIADDESKPVEDANQSNETSLNVAESEHRRRACTRTTSAIFDYFNDSDNESENSDEVFQISSKRQKAAPEKRVAPHALRDKRVESTSKNELDKNAVIKKLQHVIPAKITVVSDDDAETEEEIDDEPPNKLQRSISKQTASSVYPRRIIPPKWGANRSRRPLRSDDRTARLPVMKKLQQHDENDQVQCVNEIRKQKDSFHLQDTEIAKALENDDDGNDKDVFTTNEHTEIKPLRLSSRVKLGIDRLMEAQEKTKEADAIDQERERIKKELLNRQREERLKKRIRNEKEKMKREEALQLRKAQREYDWNAVSDSRRKGQSTVRTELFPDGGSQNSDGPIPTQTHSFTTCENEGDLCTDDTYDVGHTPECVQCPICNKKFPSQDIVAHAAVCDEFEEVDSSDPSRSNLLSDQVVAKPSRRQNASKLECQVCAAFTTTDENQFADHVHYCTKHHRDSRTVSVVNRIIEVSSSPPRAVRPISEQTDSEIDYKGQFLPKTRSKTNAGKKRKR